MPHHHTNKHRSDAHLAHYNITQFKICVVKRERALSTEWSTERLPNIWKEKKTHWNQRRRNKIILNSSSLKIKPKKRSRYKHTFMIGTNVWHESLCQSLSRSYVLGKASEKKVYTRNDQIEDGKKTVRKKSCSICKSVLVTF